MAFTQSSCQTIVKSMVTHPNSPSREEDDNLTDRGLNIAVAVSLTYGLRVRTVDCAKGVAGEIKADIDPTVVLPQPVEYEELSTEDALAVNPADAPLKHMANLRKTKLRFSMFSGCWVRSAVCRKIEATILIHRQCTKG